MLEGMGEMTFQHVHVHNPLDLDIRFEQHQPGNHDWKRNVDGDIESKLSMITVLPKNTQKGF